jgi:predicted metal-dependent HD superfamily phosphohydrolase
MPLSADIDFLDKKWKYLTTNLNPELAEKWFAFIVDHYSEKYRFYHNLLHIQSLLEYAEKYASELNNIDTVQWAIWFHDIVYNPQSKENEAKSNEIWLSFVQEAQITEKNTINAVQAMILGSAKHTLDSIPKELLSENDKDILYFFDFDLSILGAEFSVYEKYAESIRKEYAFVPDTMYQEGRKRVLESFLLRQIYHSPDFKLLEPKAKENMKQEFVKLKNI